MSFGAVAPAAGQALVTGGAGAIGPRIAAAWAAYAATMLVSGRLASSAAGRNAMRRERLRGKTLALADDDPVRLRVDGRCLAARPAPERDAR